MSVVFGSLVYSGWSSLHCLASKMMSARPSDHRTKTQSFVSNVLHQFPVHNFYQKFFHLIDGHPTTISSWALQNWLLSSHSPHMLQKLSKCEVKPWLCWNVFMLPPLRFYMKSNFGNFKRSINVNFGNFRDCEFGNLVNLGLESCSNLRKSKFRTFEIVKNDIFGPFDFPKIWFHVISK